MSDRWGSFEENAKLRERLSVIETNLPMLRADIKQLNENQATNRSWTEEQFKGLTSHVDSKIVALTEAINAKPLPTPEQSKTYNAVVAIGVGIGIIAALLLFLWVRLGMPS